jgi:hypothetical protein
MNRSGLQIDVRGRVFGVDRAPERVADADTAVRVAEVDYRDCRACGADGDGDSVSGLVPADEDLRGRCAIARDGRSRSYDQCAAAQERWCSQPVTRARLFIYVTPAQRTA